MSSYTRRSVLRSIPLALASTAGCAAPTRERRRTATDVPREGWPTFRFDDRNTGARPGESGPIDGATKRWTYETGGPIWGSPVVADGVVYIGSHDGNLYALDAATGERVWRFGTGGRIESTPAVVDGTVYVGSTDRNVYAIDAATGREEWRYETGGLIRGSPAIGSDTLYIGGNCRHLECAFYRETETPTPAGGGGHVFALDRATGDLEWQYETGDEVISTPAVGDGVVYLGSSDGYVYALDAATGERVWRYGTDDWVIASPSLVDATVYVPSMDGTLYALDAAAGEAVWTFETRARYVSGSTAVLDDTVYLGVPAPARLEDFDDLAKLHAIDAATGEPRWTYTTEFLEIGSSPAVTGDAVYVGSHNVVPEIAAFPKFYAVSRDGDGLWTHPVAGEGVGSSPAVVDGVVYFGGDDGVVYALE